MSVILKFGEEARQPILVGAEKIAHAVRVTLGPWGRNASIRRQPIQLQDGSFQHRSPMVTKDGVSVANKVTSLSDPFEDMGVQIVKEAAQRTNRLAGDGTTTATILAHEMMKDGAELLAKGANAIHVKKGMQKACEAVCAKLESMKRNVAGDDKNQTLENLKSIATISASQDEQIGSLVAMIIDEVGKDGAVSIEKGMGTGLEYELTTGMQIITGYASRHFAMNAGMANVKRPYVLVTTDKITSIRQIMPLIGSLREHDEEASLVIFSTGVEGDALTTLVANLPTQLSKSEGSEVKGLVSLVLAPPLYGQRQLDILEDIAIATGARLIDKKTGQKIESMTVSDLGTAEGVLATATITTIVGLDGSVDKRKERADLIKAALAATDEDKEKDYLQMRLANITGKMAKIYVGGSSQMEQLEKQHRVEDAIAATRAAYETGILPGGGTAFLRCLMDTDIKDKDERAGWYVVMNVLPKQLWWVSQNAGEDPEAVVEKVKGLKESEGFNAETGAYGDMFEMKVIDPTRVPVTALKNAVSVASMFLTTEVVISEEDSPQK